MERAEDSLMDESVGNCPRSDDASAQALELHNQREWFASLAQKTQKYVYSRIRRLIPNRATVDQLVQQTFLKAWRSRKAFDGRSDGLPWMLRVAERVVVDHFRAEHSKK